MIKGHKLFYGLSIIIFIISLAFSFILFNLLVNLKFMPTNSNIEFSDLIIKSTSPLLGGLLSGLIAMLIFYLNKIKDEQLKAKNSRTTLEIIKSEIADNQRYSRELSAILNSGNLESIVEMLQSEKPIQEKLIIISTKFSTEIIDKTITNLSKEDYLLVAREIKTIKMILSSLVLLTTKIDERDNKKVLLERLSILLKDLVDNEIPVIEESQKSSISNILKNGWENGVIITALFCTFISLIAFYFISK